MKFGQRDFGASEVWFSGIQNEKVASGGSRIALAGVPAVLGQTVKVNSNAKAQFSKYKTCSWKASTNPGNPERNPDGGREEKGGVWRAQGTVEHQSKSDKKDAHEVKKIVVKMFQRFPPK